MFLSSLPAQNGQFSVVLDSLSAVTCSVALLSHNNNIIYAIFCIITSLLFVDVFDSLVESIRYGCSGVHHEFHHHHPHILFLQWMALKLSPALLQTCLYFAAAQTYRGVRKWHICMRCCAQILKLLLLCWIFLAVFSPKSVTSSYSFLNYWRKKEVFLSFKLQNSNSINKSGFRKFGEIKVPFSRPGDFGE